jgi:DNA-binding transcriptional LysR family regulator
MRKGLVLPGALVQSRGMEPDWDDLKVLLALARGGSVAAAARELNVDHSTVSRRLAAIEEGFGAKLLIRGGREFAWTTEGKTVLAAAETARCAIIGASRQVRTARQEISGLVRVATTPSSLVILSEVLPHYQGRYPSLTFEFIASLDRVDLAKGMADIALRFAEPTEPDLIGRHVIDGGFALYASKSYVAQHGVPESANALCQHRLVLFAESMHRYGIGLRWLEDHRRETSVITRVDNLQSAEQLISLGRGIGALACYQGDANPALQRVFPDPIAQHPGFLVYHVSLRDAACIRAALEVLTDALTSQADRFAGRLAAAGT